MQKTLIVTEISLISLGIEYLHYCHTNMIAKMESIKAKKDKAEEREDENQLESPLDLNQ